MMSVAVLDVVDFSGAYTSVGGGSTFGRTKAAVIAMPSHTSVPARTMALLAEHGGYCETLFARLAADAPDELLGLVRVGTLKPAKLTFAAEALGLVEIARAESPLRDLLRHPSALVREGAVYGVQRARLVSLGPTLKKMAAADPSPGVRQAAEDAADELAS